MLKQRVAVALTTLGVATALAACGGSDPAETSSSSSTATSSPSTDAKPASFPDYARYAAPTLKPADGMSLAVVMADTTDPVQKSLLAGIEDQADELGLDAETYIAKGIADIASQVSSLETAIASKPRAIVLFPGSPTAMNTQIRQAEAQGIKVVNTLLPTLQPVDYSLASSLEAQGAGVATAVAEQLGGRGEVYLVMGAAGSVVNSQYKQGAKDALARYPGIEITFERDFPGFSPADAQQATENGLTQAPDVDGVISNGTQHATGILRALQQAGKRDVPVTGSGLNSASQIDLLREGQLAAVSVTPFYRAGSLAVDWAVALTQGAKPSEPRAVLPTAILTSSNIDQALDSGFFFRDLMAPSVLGCGPGTDEDC